MILCVLVSASRAQGEVKNGNCDIFIQDGNNLTLNCSRRNIDRIPAWTEEINKLTDKGNTCYVHYQIILIIAH